MRQFHLVLTAFLISLPLFVSAATMKISGSGIVTTIRVTSEYNTSVLEGGSEMIFKLSSGHDGCDYLGVNSKDTAFVSLLLSAQAQSKAVTVWYYSDKFSPIWPNVCQAATIELSNN
ncbi:hypothetical protein [uncultured Shewanella sp.]|uniref:hypothetical protein n=1 Tax=uncultured Shewanella sp. TaxID=173975 RepID=UPI00260DB2EE|nr:hypothetical protein [uncultured Shewanella sp.]